MLAQLLRPEVLRDIAVTVQPAWAGSAAQAVCGDTPVIWPDAAGAVEVIAIALSTPSQTMKAAVKRASRFALFWSVLLGSGLLGRC